MSKFRNRQRFFAKATMTVGFGLLVLGGLLHHDGSQGVQSAIAEAAATGEVVDANRPMGAMSAGAALFTAGAVMAGAGAATAANLPRSSRPT